MLEQLRLDNGSRLLDGVQVEISGASLNEESVSHEGVRVGSNLVEDLSDSAGRLDLSRVVHRSADSGQEQSLVRKTLRSTTDFRKLVKVQGALSFVISEKLIDSVVKG